MLKGPKKCKRCQNLVTQCSESVFTILMTDYKLELWFYYVIIMPAFTRCKHADEHRLDWENCAAKRISIKSETENSLCNINLLVIRSRSIKMSRAVHQPCDIEINDCSSEVSYPQSHPRVFVPSVDRHNRWQSEGENCVKDFVVSANWKDQILIE